MTTGEWRTSTYSGTNGDCIEVHGSLHRVRDSKAKHGPELAGPDVRSLVGALRAGRIRPV